METDDNKDHADDTAPADHAGDPLLIALRGLIAQGIDPERALERAVRRATLPAVKESSALSAASRNGSGDETT